MEDAGLVSPELEIATLVSYVSDVDSGQDRSASANIAV
jgi:hypothetical protein